MANGLDLPHKAISSGSWGWLWYWSWPTCKMQRVLGQPMCRAQDMHNPLQEGSEVLSERNTFRNEGILPHSLSCKRYITIPIIQVVGLRQGNEVKSFPSPHFPALPPQKRWLSALGFKFKICWVPDFWSNQDFLERRIPRVSLVSSGPVLGAVETNYGVLDLEKVACWHATGQYGRATVKAVASAEKGKIFSRKQAL